MAKVRHRLSEPKHRHGNSSEIALAIPAGIVSIRRAKMIGPAMTAEKLKAVAVLLAARLSQRMGERNKLLIDIAGEPLVRRTAKTYLDAGAGVHAVLGHEAELVRKSLEGLPVSFVHNRRYEEGQHSSVLAGIDSLGESYGAILVALSNQAALISEDVLSLLAAFAESGGGKIAVPYYGDQRGNPVVFPGALIADMRVDGRNVPGRAFIDQNPQLTLRYAATSIHFAIDIDTPDDLAAFESKQKRFQAT
jgi:molybdenum cofactor cytidylyltransferase